MDLSSMRPSSWNGVGAIAKVPAALWVSFVICASIQLRSLRSPRLTQNLTSVGVRPHAARTLCPDGRSADPGVPPLPLGEVNSKPPRARLDLFLGKENLLGVF